MALSGTLRCLSRQAQARLEAEGVRTRVIDLRWLAPLPVEAMIEAVRGCGSVLVVDECRYTGGQAEALMAHLHEAGIGSFARVTAEGVTPSARAAAARLPRSATSTKTVIAFKRSMRARVYDAG